MISDPSRLPEIDAAAGADEVFMRHAMELARQAAAAGEVPIGAVVVKGGVIIGRGMNDVELQHDATKHAEMIALRRAAEFQGDWRMEECTMFVTKEPCAMCSGALVNARMKRVCFGVRDPRCGGGGSSGLNVCNYPGMLWQVETCGGVLEADCLQIIRDFFAEVRRKNKIKD